MKKKTKCLRAIPVMVIGILVAVLLAVLPKDNEEIITNNQAVFLTEEPISADKYVNIYENNGTLYIDGKDVSDKTCVSFDYENNRCILSLIYIAQYLGCDVYGNGEYEYTLIYGDDYYTLDTSKNIMTLGNNKMNVIGDPDPVINPHAESSKEHIEPFYKRTRSDYLVDSNALNHFLYLLNYEILIDYKCATVSINKANNPPVTLVVNSKEMPLDENIRINYEERYAEIPLLSVLNEAGVEVKRIDAGKYSLEKDQKKFILDTQNNSLTESNFNTLRFRLINIFKGKNYDLNIFNDICGGKVWYYYKQTKDDYYISTDIAILLLSDLGYTTEIDYENSRISIFERTVDN